MGVVEEIGAVFYGVEGGWGGGGEEEDGEDGGCLRSLRDCSEGKSSRDREGFEKHFK